mgnify:CR=1
MSISLVDGWGRLLRQRRLTGVDAGRGLFYPTIMNAQSANRARSAYTQRHRALGLCIMCPRPSHAAGRCLRHYKHHLQAKRVGVPRAVVGNN